MRVTRDDEKVWCNYLKFKSYEGLRVYEKRTLAKFT